MSQFQNFKPSYPLNKRYQRSVAYFCMEYAIDQSLKIYSGGLGFLAGSHMRSAYEQKQNMIGIQQPSEFLRAYYHILRSSFSGDPHGRVG